jgi:phosphoribosylglycinamide formyltransferase 2
MSSSGKGQSLLRGPDDVAKAWEYAVSAGRVDKGRVIVEGFIDFDYEITQLTVRASDGQGGIATHFATPSAICKRTATTWKAGSRSR